MVEYPNLYIESSIKLNLNNWSSSGFLFISMVQNFGSIAIILEKQEKASTHTLGETIVYDVNTNSHSMSTGVMIMTKKFLIFCLLFALIDTAVLHASNRTALVIGNSNYTSSPLKNPINDAKDIATILHKNGFSVSLLLNATRKDFKKAVKAFGIELRRKKGVGLFYFAGHGMQIEGHNYLVPVNADIESESDIEFESVDAGQVLGKMADAKNSLNIIILDACRNNPYARSFRSSNRGLARVVAPSGSIVAYATAPGSVAADGEGRNSIYTEYLLKNIVEPGLKIEDIFKNVRIAVATLTHNKQIPWESSSLMGEFYFNTEMKTGNQHATAQNLKTRNKAEQERLAAQRNEFEMRKKDLEIEKIKREKVKLELERKKLEQELRRIEEEKKVMLKEETLIVERDGQYEKSNNGIVFDSATSLEWFLGPEKNMGWHESKKWISNLTIGGGGWRMPSRKELRTVSRRANEVNILIPFLRSSACNLWYSNSSIEGFKTGSGCGMWPFVDVNTGTAIAVRSLKH